MEVLKVLFCICIYLMTQVCGRPVEDQDMFSSTCWRLRGTSLKLCVEEDDDVMLDKRTPIRVLRQFFSVPVPGNRDVSKVSRDFTFPGGHKIFPAKKDSSDDTYIDKRPFDSINYNTGLGGFK